MKVTLLGVRVPHSPLVEPIKQKDMTIGISVIICLLILILFAVSEVWCKLKDVNAKLSWLIHEMYGIEDEDEDEDEKTEAQ